MINGRFSKGTDMFTKSSLFFVILSLFMISCQGGGAGHSSASQYLRSDDGASDNTPSGRDVLAKADKDELDAADKTYQELKSSSDTAFANLKDWDKQISADTINVKTGQKIDQEGGDNCKNETFMTELNDAKNALVTSKNRLVN